MGPKDKTPRSVQTDLNLCCSQNPMFSPMASKGFNSFPDDKNLTMSKLKAFADDKINVTYMIIFVFDRVENIVGKGENAGYQHSLLFPQCFGKSSFPDTPKSVIVWEWVKLN